MFKNYILNEIADNCYFGRITTDNEDLLVFELVTYTGEQIYRIVRFKEFDLEFICDETHILEKDEEIRLFTKLDLRAHI